MKLNAVRLALLQKQLDHICRQMGSVMLRTARSPIFSQSHDFSCFLGTSGGEVVAQADGIPIHTGGAGFALRAVLRDFGSAIARDDVYLSSDPYTAGGNHLPDWTMIRPVFLNDLLVGFACNRAHQADIGGGAAGTYNPSATEIFHEGIRLPVLRLVEGGRIRDDIWRLLLLNSRCPEPMDGDLRAMLGTTEIGAERMRKVLGDLGETVCRAALEQILEHAERLMSGEISLLPDGVYLSEDCSDNDCFNAISVPVKLALTVRDNRMTLDFTGSHPQISGFKNSSIANTYSAVFVGLVSFLGTHLARNEGALRPLVIIAPEGTVVNARLPAAMTMNTMFPAAEIINACWRALSQADPTRASATWGKACYCSTSGRDAAGSTFSFNHWHASSGSGAVRGRDGFNAFSQVISMGGLGLPNVESYEEMYPIRIQRYEFRQDSSGAGAFRGGSGVDYAADIYSEAEYSFRGEGLRTPSGQGTNGGAAGAKGELSIVTSSGARIEVPQYGVVRLPPVHVSIKSSAGGGWGTPLERDPHAVLRDVEDGLVSVEMARTNYAVEIDQDRMAIDWKQTHRLRNRTASGEQDHKLTASGDRLR